MDVRLHLCGPKGDGSRLLWDRLLEIVQQDNEYVVQAMLRAGQRVPDSVEELGIPYRDDVRLDPNSTHQELHGLRAMLERRSFSCGDAAPFEAAVLKVKYGIPAHAFSQFGTHEGWWHGVYRTPQGVVDPIARFLAARRAG